MSNTNRILRIIEKTSLYLTFNIGYDMAGEKLKISKLRPLSCVIPETLFFLIGDTIYEFWLRDKGAFLFTKNTENKKIIKLQQVLWHQIFQIFADSLYFKNRSSVYKDILNVASVMIVDSFIIKTLFLN
jgi:hypothetical protein